MTSYALTKNYNETSRQLNIPASTVEKTVKENINKGEFVKLCADKKEEFSVKASEVIKLLLNAAEKKAKRLLNDEELLDKTKITDITTSLATLYDKRALNDGESTQNITFSLPDEVKKYAE